MTVYRAQGVKTTPCAVFRRFLVCFLVWWWAGVRPAEGCCPTSLKTGGAPTTISPVSAMFLRLRRKNIADTREIVVGAPPVMKTCGPSPPREVFRIQKKRALLRPRRCLLHRFVPGCPLRMSLCGAEASPRGSLMPRDGGLLTNFSGLLTWPEPRLSGFHG